SGPPGIAGSRSDGTPVQALRNTRIAEAIAHGRNSNELSTFLFFRAPRRRSPPLARGPRRRARSLSNFEGDQSGPSARLKGGDMKVFNTTLAACAVATVVAAPAWAQEVDWKKVDEAFGRSGAVAADVHRYGFPRSDLTVTLDGVTIKPSFALGSWIAMK